MPVRREGAESEHHGAAPARGGAEKSAYVRAMFSDIAARYDLLNRLLSFNIDRRWRRLAIDAMRGDLAGGPYLDLCAGTLDVAAELTREGGLPGEVVAVDFAEPMLRAGAGKGDARRIHPVAADALRLPLREASCAAGVVAFGIRNVADVDSALREAHRVLRPGARFVVLEFSTPPSAVVRVAYHAYFRRILPLVGGLVSGNRSAYRYLPASVAQFLSPEDLASAMRRSGFREVQWRALTMGVATLHAGVR